jgi:hypothetical protein
MQFTAKDYYQVGLERMQAAHRIYREGMTFALAMYCAGLAVESLLRAFRWTEDTAFEGRHDLAALLRASRLFYIDEDHLRRRRASHDDIHESGLKLRAAMNEVTILWHNSLRFASEASLKAFLRRIDRLQGVKGDPLKKNASDLIEAAQTVVSRGVVLWTSKTRS